MSVTPPLITTLLFSAFLPLFSPLSNAQEAIQINKKIDLNTSHNVTIKLKEDEYVTGHFHSKHEQASLSLWHDNQRIRWLSLTGQSNSDFRFVSQKTADYVLTIDASSDDEYTLRIEQSISASGHPVSSPELLSPHLQSALQTYNATKSTQAFWDTVTEKGTPLVEPKDDTHSIVTFLWRGAKRNVRILGAPSSDHDPLLQLDGSDIWYRSYVLPNDTRLSYRLAPDVPELPEDHPEHRLSILSTAQQDPLNPNTMEIYDQTKPTDQFSRYSTLTLPSSMTSPWLADNKVPTGQLVHTTFFSPTLNNTRNVTLYRPAGFDDSVQADSYPLAIFFDGEAYQHKVPTPQILDNLIAAKKIPPTLAIFIDNPSREARSAELPCNPVFAKALATEILPWVSQQTHQQFRPETTLLSGSSYGGLASACTAFSYPEKFGLVLSQSGSFWWSPKEENSEWLARHIASTPTKTIRFYLNAGRFETGRGSVDILESNRHLHNILQAKGYPTQYEEYSSGHDYYQWRNNQATGLINLLGEHANQSL